MLAVSVRPRSTLKPTGPSTSRNGPIRLNPPLHWIANGALAFTVSGVLKV